MNIDSLAYLALASGDSAGQAAGGLQDSEILTDTLGTVDSVADSNSLRIDTSSPISMASVESILSDSLRRTTRRVARLERENTALTTQLDGMKQKFDAYSSQQIDTAELGKSLSKLEDKQLGNILAGLDLGVVEQLYAEVSGRDRSRLLQNMPPDRAARFVKMLVSGPISANEMVSQQPIGVDVDRDVDIGGAGAAAGAGAGADSELAN
jgi:flagellar motility protein MotE (MotC chaperone)